MTTKYYINNLVNLKLEIFLVFVDKLLKKLNILILIGDTKICEIKILNESDIADK